MRKSSSKSWLNVVVAFLLCCAWGAGTAYAQDKNKEELLKKIRDLEAKKKELSDQSQKNITSKKEKGSLEDIIVRYETLLGGCTKKSERCADVLFTLAQLYYDQGRDAYIKAREDYGSRMDAWEKTHQGPEPVNPIPNYSKAMKMYLRLAREYTEFRTIDEAFFQMGNIYLVMGDLDSAAWAMELVVKANPNGCRAAQAHFRLADFAYLQRDFPKALKHLELCKPPECLSPDNMGMVQYRKGEINYNMGEFDKAVQLFYEYIEKCDKGERREASD